MARYAAIDIGSNSIRMEAAEVTPGMPTRILAADRQVTRLGESVFRSGSISPEAMQLAVTVLARMADTYKKLDVMAVRAVATSAVRDTRNQAEFIELASEAIGAPVEIISGREESRLVHLGVQSRWPHPDKRILIVDIGGGSAELIASENGRLRESMSKPLGAVRLAEMFLSEDPPSERHLHHMREYIDEKLANAIPRIGVGSWDHGIATSATASAVICAVHRIPRTKREQADRARASAAQVRQLYSKISSRSLAERRKITGIGPKRAEIIVPGTAVLLRAMETFGLASFYYSAAGVRDGIIADLASRRVGRELSQLSRDQRIEVEHMSSRYGVPLRHARKVADLSRHLFVATMPLHQLPPQFGKLLEAAAYLHDVGHYVNDVSHHKHSYYLVANSDFAGFTDREREVIANLCRYHRKTMPTSGHSPYQGLSGDEKRAVLFLIPLLRLADNLDRSHEQHVESVNCRLHNGHFVVQLMSAPNVDVDLEQWAAERVGEIFRQVYERPITVVKSRS